MKVIISWFLRYIPRPFLQRVSHYIVRVLALFYKGDKVQCPVCQNKYRVFLPYGRVGRSNALCPGCLSLERHRMLWLYLQRETDFFTRSAKMLHVAPELCFMHRFEKMTHLDYITGDIESPLAKVKMDIHRIPFSDNTFDIVFCNHVLEHVKDDLKALSEIYRVLKPEGWAILQIPLFYPLAESTVEDTTITDPRAREKLFGQDDHVRKYGLDFPDRIESVGFKVPKMNFVDRLSKEEIEKYALPSDDRIFVAHKYS